MLFPNSLYISFRMGAREYSKLKYFYDAASNCLLIFKCDFWHFYVNLLVSLVYLIIFFKFVFLMNSSKVAKCESK